MVGASLNLTFVYLNFVDETVIMEQYGNEVGLAALEWCGPRNTDVAPGKSGSLMWLVDKWTSPCPW